MKIQPYIKFDSFKGAENILQKHEFEVTALDADLTKEGWIRVYVAWRAVKDCYKFKYPQFNGSMLSLNNVAGCFKFSEFKYRWTSTDLNKKKTRYTSELGFEVGIQNLDSDEFVGGTNKNAKIEYNYKFHENLKYGMLVWFSPKTWNSGENEINLFTLPKEEV